MYIYVYSKPIEKKSRKDLFSGIFQYKLFYHIAT